MTQTMEDMTSIRLGCAQTLGTCRDLAARLRHRLQAGSAVVVDAAEFVEGDITAVQVLLAARRTATAIGCSFTVVNPSPGFIALQRRSGVAAV